METLGNLTFIIWVKWLVLVACWGGLAYWFLQEYRTYKEVVYKTKSGILTRMYVLARNRSVGVLALFLGLIVTIIAYDVMLASKPAITVMTTAAWSPMPPTDLQAAKSPVSANPITELYADTQTAADQADTQLDQLKQKYEQAFVTYYYLKRCSDIPEQDFHVINKALFNELAATNTPATLQQDIIQAARGSYTEMYSRSPCTDATVAALTQQYRVYRQQLEAINANAEAAEAAEILTDK